MSTLTKCAKMNDRRSLPTISRQNIISSKFHPIPRPKISNPSFPRSSFFTAACPRPPHRAHCRAVRSASTAVGPFPITCAVSAAFVRPNRFTVIFHQVPQFPHSPLTAAPPPFLPSRCPSIHHCTHFHSCLLTYPPSLTHPPIYHTRTLYPSFPPIRPPTSHSHPPPPPYTRPTLISRYIFRIYSAAYFPTFPCLTDPHSLTHLLTYSLTHSLLHSFLTPQHPSSLPFLLDAPFLPTLSSYLHDPPLGPNRSSPVPSPTKSRPRFVRPPRPLASRHSRHPLIRSPPTNLPAFLPPSYL